MKITRQWLENNSACLEGTEWFLAEKHLDAKKGIQNLIAKDKLQWANWLLVRVLTHKQRIAYSIFAAESVIENYEKLYTTDNRPRQAIQEAKNVVRRNTIENRLIAAESAWLAARSAWLAARSAGSAARSAMMIKILAYGLTLVKGKK